MIGDIYGNTTGASILALPLGSALLLWLIRNCFGCNNNGNGLVRALSGLIELNLVKKEVSFIERPQSTADDFMAN